MICSAAMAGNDKKYEKTMQRANAFYEHFSYHKAINLYEEALGYKNNQTPKIQLANCYRKLNHAEESLEWYQKALLDGPLGDEDMLHYGQVLSTSQNYDSAHVVLSKYQHLEEWVGDRADGFKNVDKFYRNEIAYLINESIFNSEEADFSPAWKDDGLVFVTGRPFKGMFKPRYNSDDTFFLNLFEVKKDEEPKKVERGLNTRYHEGPSVYYANETKLIFTRNNYNEHTAGESEHGINHLKLYFSELESDKKWSNPTEFPYNSDQFSIGHPTLTSDEQTLYFGSDMPGGIGGVDLYKSTLVNGKWSEPENLGERFNTARDEMFPFMSIDEFLYFASDGHEGMGGLDIFRVDMTRANSKPRNMGFSLNTHKDDFGIILNEEGNKGYFSSNREGGTGDDDIYELVIFDYIITVNLRDDESKELISGNVKAEDIILKEIVGESETTIKFPAIKGDAFFINGMSPDYFSDSLLIETKEASREVRQLVYDIYLKKPATASAIVYRVEINQQWKQVMYNMDSSLNMYDSTYSALTTKFEKERVTIDSVVTLKNVLFDFDKSNIREDAVAALDEWLVFLNQYPDQKISLGSHTDTRGSNKYNERLGKRRIKSTLKYLLKAGISKDRFVKGSYGEEQLFSDCGEDCEDEVAHQNNRRTEILVIRE